MFRYLFTIDLYTYTFKFLKSGNYLKVITIKKYLFNLPTYNGIQYYKQYP